MVLIIPDGGSIPASDFAAAADAVLAEATFADEAIAAQARAAVKAAKALVAAGHVGEERVFCVVSTRIDPNAVPAGTGHIVSIELSSRPSPLAVVSEEEAAKASEQPPSSEAAATESALKHAEANGIDVSQIVGSGKDGKVIKADVDAAIAAKASEQPPS